MSQTELSPNLQSHIKQIKTDVDRELGLYWDLKISEAAKIDPQYKRLLTEMKKFSLRGGKRLRPFMAFLGFQIAGGKDYKAFLRIALVWEMYHLFAIMHDDIMDQDEQRYGGLNVAGVYNRLFKRSHDDHVAHSHSLNMALIAGDIALGFAHEILDSSMIDSDTRDQLKRLLNKLHFQLAAGQMLDDLAGIDGHLNPDKIKKIYLLKTARYSMIAPMQSGAIVVGGNQTILDILERYGYHAGIAYQIVDDLLGMYGSTREIGKPNITDLREGKKTLLMYYGFQFADETQKVVLKKYFGNPNIGPAELKIVRKILTENGAKAKTIFMAHDEAEKAKKAIGKLALPGGLGDEFINFTDYLISRTK
ncbi:MAG: polyprenyl synthetase family protein [bacterium]